MIGKKLDGMTRVTSLLEKSIETLIAPFVPASGSNKRHFGNFCPPRAFLHMGRNGSCLVSAPELTMEEEEGGQQEGWVRKVGLCYE